MYINQSAWGMMRRRTVCLSLNKHWFNLCMQYHLLLFSWLVKILSMSAARFGGNLVGRVVIGTNPLLKRVSLKIACTWIKWVMGQIWCFNNVIYSIVAAKSKFIIGFNMIERKQIFNTWRTQPVLQVVKHVFKFYRKQWDTFHMVKFFATVTVDFIYMIGDRLTTNGTVRHDTNPLGWKAWQEQKHLNDNLIFRIDELHETIKEIQWEQLNWVNL